MRIKWQDKVVAIGAGAVDQFLEDSDATATTPRLGTKSWHFWARLGGTVLGLASEYTGRYTEFGEALGQSELTLLTKSVYTMVKERSTSVGSNTMRSRVMHMAGISQLAPDERVPGSMLLY